MASTPDSAMVDKTLRRPAGVSFDVIQGLETVIINKGDNKKTKYLEEGRFMRCVLRKKAWSGKIVKVRGHKVSVEFLKYKHIALKLG